jgi:hypothetical protein
MFGRDKGQAVTMTEEMQSSGDEEVQRESGELPDADRVAQLEAESAHYRS